MSKNNFSKNENKGNTSSEMFSRKLEDETSELSNEVDSVRLEKNIIIKDAERQARLEERLINAKAINYSGFAINGSSIIVLLFGIDNFISNPDNISMMQGVNDTLGFGVDVEGLLAKVQEFKAQIIGICISMQTFFAYWQDVCQKMKSEDREDTLSYINEELERLGI